MQKPISTRVHGILDYMTAGFLFALPRAMGWSKTVTRLMDAAGMSATAYSLFTRYELGLVRVLPVKAHLTMDAMSGAAFLGAAAMLDDEDPEVRACLASIGLWEITAALLTETRSPVRERLPKSITSGALQGGKAAKSAAREAGQRVPALQGL
jgi:hypothetical protein